MEVQQGIIPSVSRYSVEVNLAIDRLLQLEYGDTVSYADLSQACGVDVQVHRVIYQTAAKRLQADSNKIFSVVPKVGIQLLPHEEVVNSGFKTINKIRRAAKKGIDRVSTVDYSALSPQGRVRHNVQSAVLNFVHHGTKRQALKQIQNGIETKAGAALPLRDTLALLQ